MNNGFIRLHRKFLSWEWYRHPNTKLLFLHLLLIASWKECKWHGIEIHPGEAIRTDENLSKEIGITKRQVRSSFLSLRQSGEVSMRYVAGNRIITIKNWAKYQSDVTAPVTPTVTSRSPKLSTYEEYKEIKNIRSMYSNTPPTFEEIQDYCFANGYQNTDIQAFMDYNEAQNWKMDWKKALVLWNKKDKERGKRSGNQFTSMIQHDDYDMADIEAAWLEGSG